MNLLCFPTTQAQGVESNQINTLLTFSCPTPACSSLLEAYKKKTKNSGTPSNHEARKRVLLFLHLPTTLLPNRTTTCTLSAGIGLLFPGEEKKRIMDRIQERLLPCPKNATSTSNYRRQSLAALSRPVYRPLLACCGSFRAGNSRG